jgi:hypothetical protein
MSIVVFLRQLRRIVTADFLICYVVGLCSPFLTSTQEQSIDCGACSIERNDGTTIRFSNSLRLLPIYSIMYIC